MNQLKWRHPFMQIVMLAGLLGVGLVLAGALGMVLLPPLTGYDIMSINSADLTRPQAVMAWRLVFAINTIGVFLIPGILFALLYDYPPLHKIGFRKVRVENLLLGIVLIAAALPLVNSLSILNKSIHLPESLRSWENLFRESSKGYEEKISKVINMPSQGILLLNMLIMAFLPALAEELFFRGCLQQCFQQWCKHRWTAVVMGGLVFSLFHFDFYGFFPRWILGILLGWLFYTTGSLWPGIAAHFFNNAMALIFTYAGQHAIVKKNYVTQDIEWPLWTGLISLICVVYLFRLLKQDHTFEYPNKGLHQPSETE